MATAAAFDSDLEVLVALVEQKATSPSDLIGLGLTVADRQSHALVPPEGLEVRYDANQSIIIVRVQRPAGINTFTTEISSDPAGPATWQQLEGTGARRKITGYAPGRYWIRAASLRAVARSSFTDPVSVIVK